ARGVLRRRTGCPGGALARPHRHARHRADPGTAPRPHAALGRRQATAALVGLVLELPLHGLAPLLTRLRRLALSLDRRLLVVNPPLHLLKEAVLQHQLLELLQGGLDLIVEDVDLHGSLRCRVDRCVDRWEDAGTELSTTFITLSLFDPCSMAPA